MYSCVWLHIYVVNPKGNKPWMLIVRTDAEAESSLFWPPDVKSRLIGTDPDAGKGWRQKEKRATDDETVGWQHRFSEHEFGWPPGDGEGQRGLVCCSLRGCKESDTTYRLDNNNNNNRKHIFLTQSSVDGFLGCFHILAVVNNAAWIFWNYCFYFFWIYTQEWNRWIMW